jgi:sugar phosphate isomerase/epimerase
LKLGAITNGISEDLEHALQIMKRDGLEYAELQFVWETEIGEHTGEQNNKIKELLDKYGMKVSVITKHNFNKIPVMNLEVGDPLYNQQMDGLKRSIAVAKLFNTKLVRTMTFAKANVIWGSNGADRWLANNNQYWPKLLKLLEKPVQLAEDNGMDLIMETGTFSMINNAYLARRIIEDLGSKHLKVLWDAANAYFSGEKPFPEGYDEIRDYLAHIHVKDFVAQRHKAILEFRPLGEGEMGPYLENIAAALRKDEYDGVVSFESVYQPPNGTDEDGYNACIKTFKKIFG